MSPDSAAPAAGPLWAGGTERTDPSGPFVSGPVIAGVHGSPKDPPVLAFAAAEAARTGQPLHLLCARGRGAPIVPADELDDQFLLEAQAEAARSHPDLPVRIELPRATPVQALCEASATASLVVVGADRRGPLRKAVLGTTTLATAAHAQCPVAVVPEDLDLTAAGPVVVAVDGSPDSVSAAAFGLHSARARDTDLVLLTVWHLEVVDGYVVTTPGTPAWQQVEDRHAAIVRSVLDSLPEGSRAGVPIRIEVAQGPFVSTILERSASASLLVVGSRGRGGIRGLLLGSVSHGVLQRAHLPVVVVRAHS